MVGICVVGLLAVSRKPELALLAAVGIPFGVLLLAWPNLATWGVVFLIYTNAPVIAVKFHGVPFIVGATVPLLLAIPLAYFLVIRREGLLIDPVFPLVALFVVVHLFGVLFSTKPDLAIQHVVTLVVEGVVLFFLVTNAVRDEQALRGVVWTLLVAGAFLGGLSVIQWATGTYRNHYGGFAQVEEDAGFRSEGSRVQRQGGPLGNKNRYAQIMSMLFPLGLFVAWGARSRLLRLAAWGATGFIMLGIALTFSRGAMVAFGVLVIVMLVMRLISLRQCAAVGAAAMLLVLAVPQLTDRMLSLVPLVNSLGGTDGGMHQADGSLQSRAAETLAGVLMFAEHPLTGVGPGMYPRHYPEYGQRMASMISGLKFKEEFRQPHSLYVELAAELGLPGLLLFLMIVGCVIRRLLLARRSCLPDRPLAANLALGFCLAVFMYLATGLFIHMSYIRWFWLMLGLATAAARILQTGSSSPERWTGFALGKSPTD
ncbi:MAG: O-antigen ligase family protein [Planctomycetota bacterium]|nr:MAG: O-antigen ligase family protein [Planctomycetota bacterium]REJ88823.1 MAG: O-antigen ligase family protein [Planctomycetota bacterium]REK29473.1 MAG: O-antigen ligase family protein [Planctomycetota bacterium]REK31838.1 MAG: O-antigen ligase family protein [Planctomycetota bacterium]